jgi:hypothetical protein
MKLVSPPNHISGAVTQPREIWFGRRERYETVQQSTNYINAVIMCEIVRVIIRGRLISALALIVSGNII